MKVVTLLIRFLTGNGMGNTLLITSICSGGNLTGNGMGNGGKGLGNAIKVRTHSELPVPPLSILVNRKPSQQTRYITYAYFPWNRYWGLYTGWCFRKYCCTACTATLLFQSQLCHFSPLAETKNRLTLCWVLRQQPAVFSNFIITYIQCKTLHHVCFGGCS